MNTERRDFLRLMGVVGVAALVSIANLVDAGDQTVASASAGDQSSSGNNDPTPAILSTIPEVERDSSTNQSSLPLSSAASQCRVECNRRCSYPGHCQRYTDSNGNNRCDRGE